MCFSLKMYMLHHVVAKPFINLHLCVSFSFSSHCSEGWEWERGPDDCRSSVRVCVWIRWVRIQPVVIQVEFLWGDICFQWRSKALLCVFVCVCVECVEAWVFLQGESPFLHHFSDGFLDDKEKDKGLMCIKYNIMAVLKQKIWNTELPLPVRCERPHRQRGDGADSLAVRVSSQSSSLRLQVGHIHCGGRILQTLPVLTCGKRRMEKRWRGGREKINGRIHWYFRAVFILNCSLREGVSIIKEHCTVFDPLVVAVWSEYKQWLWHKQPVV